MKKIELFMTLCTLLFVSVLCAEIQQPNVKPKNDIPFATRPNLPSRNAPNVEFATNPVSIMFSYYDYFPGGYNRIPMILQPEISMPNGFSAGGLYISFQAEENQTANRRIYYAYIDSNGNFINASNISFVDERDGFPGIDVDPLTGNPIVAWHRTSEDGTYDCFMSYDLFHVYGEPGHWKQEFVSINNPEASQPYTGHLDDEFIWPKVAIGPSPVQGKRRVYIYGDNISSNSGGTTNYNILVGKADFDADMMAAQADFVFEFTSIPELDDLHYNGIERAFKDIVVSDDGQVAFIGWYGHTFFTAYSDDFGESYTYMETNGRWDIENPQNLDGSYYFTNENGTPADIFTYPSSDGGHFNAFFNDNNQIIAVSAMGINTQENFDSGIYSPAFFYPKIYQFEINNGDFNVHVVDLQIEGAFPNDGIPVVPWDLNNDGIVDEVDENGNAIIPLAYPSHYFDGDFQNAFFHESNFRLTYNNNWVAAVWQDCEKVAMNYNEEPGFEDWAEKPEIMVAVSADYGTTWSQPAYLNAKEGDENYFPELYAMTPAYVYPADKLEVIDSNHAKLHLFFMDDYKYGSSNMVPPYDPGGMLYYASLSVEMPANWNFNNHPPYVANPLENFSMNEDSVNQSISLTNVFDDPDFVYGDALNYTFSNNINIDAQINQNSGIVTLTPELNWFGEETIHFTATDLGGLQVTEEVSIIVNNIYDPPIIINPMVNHFLINSSEQEVTVNFSEHFYHPDGLPLFYSAEYNEEQISVSFFTDGMILCSTGNWVGSTYVTVIASDGINAKASVEKHFSVAILYDLPLISFSTNTLHFETTYLDEDSAIKEIAIQNTGNTPVFVEQIAAPNDFYLKLSNQETWSELLSSFVLNECDEIILEVMLKPTEQKQYNETMEIHSNANNEPIHQIQLTAKSENPFPNAFTPNGDGINDEFTIKINSTENLPLKLIIYNSKSRKIKEISGNCSQPISWNGKDSNNNDCNATHYLYVLHKDGSVYKRGIIYLIR